MEPATEVIQEVNLKSIFVIPDLVLRHLICSDCKKYLSHPPIKNYGDGVIKCGRCSKNNGGVKSLCNLLIPDMSFKCINHYEGCNRLLQTADVSKHEFFCKGSNIVCPSCNNFTGNPLQLLSHFKTSHPGNILEKKEFGFDTDQSFYRTYLLVYFDRLFLITAIYDGLDTQLSLKLSSVGSYDFQEKPKCTFELHLANTYQICLDDAFYCRRITDENTTVFKFNAEKILKPVWICRFELNLQPFFKPEHWKVQTLNNSSLIKAGTLTGVQNVTIDFSRATSDAIMTFSLNKASRFKENSSPSINLHNVDWKFKFVRSWSEKVVKITLRNISTTSVIKTIKVNAMLLIYPRVSNANPIVIYWHDEEYSLNTGSSVMKQIDSSTIFSLRNRSKFIDGDDSIICKAYLQGR